VRYSMEAAATSSNTGFYSPTSSSPIPSEG
jgi:hypothetical protein